MSHDNYYVTLQRETSYYYRSMDEMIIKGSTVYWHLTVKQFCSVHALAASYGVCVSCRPSKLSREHIVVSMSYVGAAEAAMIIDAATNHGIPFQPKENIFFYK